MLAILVVALIFVKRYNEKKEKEIEEAMERAAREEEERKGQ